MDNVIDIRKKRIQKKPMTPEFVTGDDFSSRMKRIKSSLEKINRLMTELKEKEKNDVET